MKPRKVVIVIEAKSDLPLRELKDTFSEIGFDIGTCGPNLFVVHQVSVQVVKKDN